MIKKQDFYVFANITDRSTLFNLLIISYWLTNLMLKFDFIYYNNKLRHSTIIGVDFYIGAQSLCATTQFQIFWFFKQTIILRVYSFLKNYDIII